MPETKSPAKPSASARHRALAQAIEARLAHLTSIVAARRVECSTCRDANWADVGDLAHADELLADLEGFLTGDDNR